MNREYDARSLRRPGRTTLAVLCLTALIAGGGSCLTLFSDPNDRMLYLDPIDPSTGRVAEIAPNAPWIRPGPDGEIGTSDDIYKFGVRGDIDLVLRTGITDIGSTIPAAKSTGEGPLGLADPFGLGVPIDFVVVPVDGQQDVVPGIPVVSPSLEGAPVLVAAFADLDGDGYIGITHLDGDTLDGEIEDAELIPVGRRFAITQAGRAAGSLFVSAGGPSSAPLDVMLGAAAYTGPVDPDFFNGAVPDGPAVMTRLPFFPRLDPGTIIGGAGGGLMPADPDAREAVEIEAALSPDPAALFISEIFTLHTDGSDPSIDSARVRSGQFARFGFGLRPDPLTFRASTRRPLRPGLDDAGDTVPYEILQRLGIEDDGPASQLTLRVLPLDLLGNVADLDAPTPVTLRTGGTLRIVWPDFDGDPHWESLLIADTRGADILIDDPGSVFDDPDADVLIVEGAGAILTLDVSLPDPDVDNSLLVTETDLELVESFRGVRHGDEDFEPSYDLNRDGRIDDADADAVAFYLGTVISSP